MLSRTRSSSPRSGSSLTSATGTTMSHHSDVPSAQRSAAGPPKGAAVLRCSKTSGATKRGLNLTPGSPTAEPAPSRLLTARALPKSMTSSCRSPAVGSATTMLCGSQSRCTTPRSCMAAMMAQSCQASTGSTTVYQWPRPASCPRAQTSSRMVRRAHAMSVPCAPHSVTMYTFASSVTTSQRGTPAVERSGRLTPTGCRSDMAVTSARQSSPASTIASLLSTLRATATMRPSGVRTSHGSTTPHRHSTAPRGWRGQASTLSSVSGISTPSGSTIGNSGPRCWYFW
mmetsp:Transcript_29464/g.82295  ORF Transcript_29464/g.82295 Transcript_29464/m.82295 type:complete len:285 (-) Transcript_29464:127-981(-)